MNINKKSWHYKVVRFHKQEDWRMPTNLCSYFWNAILLTILTPVFLCVVVVISPVLGLVWISEKIGDKLEKRRERILIQKLLEWDKQRRELGKQRRELGKPPSPPKKSKTWSLIKAYLKARKDKMCPLIKYVD